MLSIKDVEKIEPTLHSFRKVFFTLISEFGPTYEGNYVLSNEKLKDLFSRQRISDSLIKDCKEYIECSGFNVEETSIGLKLTLQVQNLIQSYEDAQALENAISIYRSKNVDS